MLRSLLHVGPAGYGTYSVPDIVLSLAGYAITGGNSSMGTRNPMALTSLRCIPDFPGS